MESQIYDIPSKLQISETIKDSKNDKPSKDSKNDKPSKDYLKSKPRKSAQSNSPKNKKRTSKVKTDTLQLSKQAEKNNSLTNQEKEEKDEEDEESYYLNFLKDMKIFHPDLTEEEIWDTMTKNSIKK